MRDTMRIAAVVTAFALSVCLVGCGQMGGAMLRGVLGAAWTARSERLGVSGRCACGGVVGFRQHQHWAVHTILPGRDVGVEVQYGQCERQSRGPRLRVVWRPANSVPFAEVSKCRR